MRAVVQRVSQASVAIDSREVGRIGPGLLVLLGVGRDDGQHDVKYLAEKIVNLRIFPDENDKMNRSLIDIGGEILVVSQFTLWGDCRKGRRPSFVGAAPPEFARALYEDFIRTVEALGITVASGRFQETMQVQLVNEGPVTMLLDSHREF